MTARFLLAKFAPDLKRMEPRNIGVIVWLDGHTDARFIGETAQSPEFSGVPRRIGVEDKHNYREWIASWRRQISKGVLELDYGKTVSRSSPDFVEALRHWSRGNYMLVDGGMIAESVTPSELKELTEYLYRELVAVPGESEVVEHEYARLKSASTQALRRSGILSRPDLQHDWPGPVRVHGVLRTFDFDYAIGPTANPYSLYHRVVLSHQKTFDSAILNIDAFRQNRQYAKERLCALIVGENNELASSKRLRDNRQIIGDVCTVIDVTDDLSAMEKLQRAAAMNGAI